MLTFKSVIGWFYYQNYIGGQKPKMWFHEVKDYIYTHQNIGQKNPLFIYDDQNMIWHLDFNRIGDDPKKCDLQTIKEHIKNIIAGFRLERNVPLLDIEKFVAKYVDAIDEFNQKKERPNGKKILSPTFVDCLPPDIKIPYEKLKNFNFSDMDCKKYS